MTAPGAPVVSVPSPSVRARVLLGGVGYTNMRDLSIGPLIVGRLAHRAWPDGVDVEDLSAGAIHVLHALQARPPYHAAVFVAGVERGEAAGTIRRYRWSSRPTSDADVQDRVGEALMGAIGLDTLLTVLDYFGALPPDTSIVEIEPHDGGWGEELSRPLRSSLHEVERVVTEAVAEVAA